MTKNILKRILPLLLAAMLLFSFAACGGTVVPYETTDDFDLRDLKRYANYQPKKEITVTVMGNEIHATFVEKARVLYKGDNYCPSYEYRGENGETLFIRSDGFVDSYRVKNDAPSDARYIFSKEVYIEKAEAVLATITDPSHYQVTEYGEMNDSRRFVWVEFHRYIGEMKTTDSVTVYLKPNGECFQYDSCMVDMIGDKTVNPFDMEKATEKAQAFVEEKMESVRDRYDRMEYSGEFQLTKLSDGSLALIYTAEIRGIKDYGEHSTVRTELLRLLIRNP